MINLETRYRTMCRRRLTKFSDRQLVNLMNRTTIRNDSSLETAAPVRR